MIIIIIITIIIGGLFNIKNSSNVDDFVQIDALRGFQLAIDEINNDPAFNTVLTLHDDSVTTGYYGKYGGTIFANDITSTANSIVNAYGTTGVDVIINAGDDDICIGSNVILTEKMVPTILLNAYSQQFGDGSAYPYKAQVNLIETYYGMVFQNIMCEHMEAILHPDRITNYAIFTSADTFGGQIKVESNDDTFCEGQMKITYAAYASADEEDFSGYIQQALDQNIKIFLVALEPRKTGLFLQQSHKYGLSKEGSQIFILDRSFSPTYSFWTDIGENKTFLHQQEVDNALLGVIAIVEAKYYHMLYSAAGNIFTNNFLTSNSLQTPKRSSITDDYEISPLAAYAYDAVYLFAIAARKFINEFPTATGITGDSTTIDNFMACFFNVSFAGATGKIDIFEGMVDFGGYGRGDREEGL